jgi:hypothetical protein
LIPGFAENRDIVGGFIYQKMAQAGLMMIADPFQYFGVAMSAQQTPEDILLTLNFQQGTI